MFVCLRVRVAPTFTPSGEENEANPSVSAVMIPGKFLWMRYTSTQVVSEAGDQWRHVRVIGPGHVADTDMGYDVDPDKDGWWCVHDNVRKFFLRIRIMEVDRAYEPNHDSTPP